MTAEKRLDRQSLRLIVAAAGLGAFLSGGFVWLWHGDWSESGNPFAWNTAAQSDFFSSLLFGGFFGAAIGLVIAIFSRRERTSAR